MMKKQKLLIFGTAFFVTLFVLFGAVLVHQCRGVSVYVPRIPDVVNVEQMCEMLGGISTKTGYRLLRSKQIKNIVVGRRYCIPKINIFEYLQVLRKSDA